MLAERLNISESGLPLQCYALTYVRSRRMEVLFCNLLQACRSRYVRLLQKGNPKADSANLNTFIKAVLCRDEMALCVCVCVRACVRALCACVREYLRANVCMWDVHIRICVHVFVHVFEHVLMCLYACVCVCFVCVCITNFVNVCMCARASTIIAMLQL